MSEKTLKKMSEIDKNMPLGIIGRPNQVIRKKLILVARPEFNKVNGINGYMFADL